jgi:hypothetical protein
MDAAAEISRQTFLVAGERGEQSSMRTSLPRSSPLKGEAEVAPDVPVVEGNGRVTVGKVADQPTSTGRYRSARSRA